MQQSCSKCIMINNFSLLQFFEFCRKIDSATFLRSQMMYGHTDTVIKLIHTTQLSVHLLPACTKKIGFASLNGIQCICILPLCTDAFRLNENGLNSNPFKCHSRVFHIFLSISFSPSGTALRKIEQIKDYLLRHGTCKCGLPCPLRPDFFFEFNPQVILVYILDITQRTNTSVNRENSTDDSENCMRKNKIGKKGLK